MKTFISGLLLLLCSTANVEAGVDRFDPKLIGSADGRKTWTVYTDKNLSQVFYSLPGLGRIKKVGRGSGLKLLHNSDGSITGYFNWVPVDRNEDAPVLSQRIKDLYGSDAQVLPLSPSKVEVSWIDLEFAFGAEILKGREPRTLPGVKEMVQFKVPEENATYFEQQMMAETCQATGNCGQLILVNYRFVMNNAGGTIDTFNHAFSVFIEAAPHCEMFDSELECLMR